MQQAAPTVYTDISQEQYDAFRSQARSHGLNISSNSETVLFDTIPVSVTYIPATKTLSIAVSEPHWLTPGVTVGVIHTMLGGIISGKDLAAQKGPQPVAAAAPAFRIAPPSLPGPVIGAAYAEKTLEASGGIAPYAWAVTAGNLPAGLKLSPAGVLAGTPTAAASTAPVTVTATDSSKPAQTASIVLSIDATGVKAKAA